MQDILAHSFCSSVPSKYDAARAGITNATYQSWSSAMSILCVLCSSSGNHNIRPPLVLSGIVREAPEIERDWLAGYDGKKYGGRKIALYLLIFW